MPCAGTHGIAPPKDIQTLRSFIGPPLHDSFSAVYGMSEAESRRAVCFFREYYRETGVYENTPYPGIGEMLSILAQSGYSLAVATSKPEVFAKKILNRFDLLHHFSAVFGTVDDSAAHKKDVLGRLLVATDLSPSRFLMVGDRKYDVQGAGHWGIGCLGVLYGYGTREELLDAGAMAVVETVEELQRFILRCTGTYCGITVK